MKRLKGIWMTFIIVILSVAMILGTGVATAFAASGSVSDVVANFTEFYTKFTYGNPYTLANGTVIKAPNGTETTVEGGSFTPDQVGAYTISYGNYSYNVRCELDGEYELRVDYDGADIPTYMTTKAKGGKMEIPAAYLYKKNDDGEFKKVTDADQKVYYKIGSGEAKEIKALGEGETRTETFDEQGTYDVLFYTYVKGGTKYLSKSYTVKVQDSFEDKVAPKLSTVNVPSDISLNTKVTLPTATATDAYDENVKVLVTVEQYTDGKYTPVLEAEVDEDGYGSVKENAQPVVFDNKYNMSFYPLVKTDYRITYQAIDDAGNKTNAHTYTAKCKDKSAPVLKEIADDQIPTKWGYKSVTRAKKEGVSGDNPVLSDLKINFPYPTYVDNSDEKLTVIFEIKDTVNKKTVIKFTNIFDYDKSGVAGAGAKYTYNPNSGTNGIYSEDATFTQNGFLFDFSKYVEKLLESEPGATYTGVYTVTYQVKDENNISTKSYDITLEDAFVDEQAPTATVAFDDDYLLVTKEEADFTIPALVASDAVDTRLAKTYKLISGDAELEVKGGESAVLVNKEIAGVTGDYLIIDEEKAQYLKLADTLTYEITVTDDVGNETVVKSSDKGQKAIKILTASSFTNPPKNITYNLNTTSEFAEGDTVNVGGFTFEPATLDLRPYTGFELTLANEDGSVYQEEVSFTYFFDGTKFNVENITFTPQVGQTYRLYIRIFDVTGKSVVKAYTCVIPKGEEGGSDPGISGANIPQDGSTFTSYKLKNETIKPTPDDIGTRKYVVRNILARGKFSIMNTEFTAYTAGTYEFEDGYYKKADKPENETFVSHQTYAFAAKQNATVAWELQDIMPSYSTIDVKDNADANIVRLPAIVANAGYENADITIKVVTPNSKELLVNKAAGIITENDKITDTEISMIPNGGYAFRVTQNGTYTVNVSATGAEAKSFTIKAGDVVAPEFTVTAPDEHMTEKSVFKFSSITVTSADDLTTDAKKSTHYVKKLIDPTGTVVFSVDGNGETNRTATVSDAYKDGYTFTKTGVYTVEYSVEDSAGNSTPRRYSITVSAKKVTNPLSTKIISTVLIIVGVLLIAGVILYFVRFRKVKNK